MRLKISKKSAARTKNTVTMSFFYRGSLADIKSGLELFKILDRYGFVPDKYGISPSNKKEPFSMERINIFLSKVWLPATKYNLYYKYEYITLMDIDIYRKTSPKYWGVVRRPCGEKAKFHSEIGFDVTIDPGNSKYLENLEGMIMSLVNYSNTDFARVQYYSADENLESCSSRATDAVNTILVARQLSEEYLPDLYNVSVWGKPYIEFFGREKLLKAPCYKVQELSSEMIWMQLGPDIYNEKGSWTALKDVRDRVKRYLSQGAFFNPDLHPKSTNINELLQDEEMLKKLRSGELRKEWVSKYSVPKFDLSDIKKPLKLPGKDE